MSIIFERITIYSKKPIKGVYRYKDSFQIFPSERKPVLEGSYVYPVSLELSFEKNEEHYFRFGFPYGSDRLTKEIIEVEHLLSLFTQFFFFNMIKSKSPITRLSTKRINKIKIGSIRWYQDKSLNDCSVSEIVIPNFLDDILDKYYNLKKREKEIFRKAMYLYYSAIELKGSYPSLSFASFVSAMETLIHFDDPKPKTCNDCKQVKGVGKRFKQNIIKYAYNNDVDSQKMKQINKLYGHRSSILHHGELLLGDLFWEKSSFDSEEKIKKWKQSFLHKYLLSITRAFLINWLNNQDE